MYVQELIDDDDGGGGGMNGPQHHQQQQRTALDDSVSCTLNYVCTKVKTFYQRQDVFRGCGVVVYSVK